MVHAATNQLEIFRVTANIVVLAWMGVVLAGRLLKREGLTNPEQGGSLRVALLLLLLFTLALSSWLILIYHEGQPD